MSLIFDALQRSEAERLGTALSVVPAAAELIQRAELHVVDQRKALVELTHPVPAHGVDQDTQLALHRTTTVETTRLDDATPVDRNVDLFGQFPTLQVSLSPQSRLVGLSDTESLAAEKFRFLGVTLQHLRRERSLKTVLITSTIPQEGKSMVSANLACILARKTQQRTLLLEGDVRRPSLSKLFGLEKASGICECLQGEGKIVSSIYRLEGPGFWFLPAGSAPTNSLELLQSSRLPALMDQLTSWFDWVIIDSPPVMPLADTSVWMRLADGILLVVRQGITEKRQLQRGLETLERRKLIGALLNGCNSRTSSDNYYMRVPSITSPPAVG